MDNTQQDKDLLKFLNSCYALGDISKVVSSLFASSKYDFKHNFNILENIKDFNAELCSKEKLVFYALDSGSLKWVLFCIEKTEEKYYVLYKDPTGQEPPQNFENELREKLGMRVVFVVHRTQDQDEKDIFNYGPIFLRNLEILMNLTVPIHENFTEITFITSRDVNQEKLKYVFSLAEELGKHKEFTKALTQFLNDLSLDFISTITREYHQIREEESKKENIDYIRITEARKKCWSEENIQKIKDSCPIDSNNVKLKIEEKYETEMKEFQKILVLLQNVKADNSFADTFNVVLNKVAQILEITCEKLEQLLARENLEIILPTKNKLSPKNIEEIEKNILGSTVSMKDDCTPFNELLQQIHFGSDSEANEHTKEIISRLKEEYNEVKKHSRIWSEKSLKMVNEWANKKKKQLQNDEVYEAIAIMDRAYCILTGYHLRDTQILTVLCFLQTNANQGKICQILTGEGKTVIVSLLATIKALQGMKVDVITSNILLADEGVKDTENFYSIFDLTVSTNNPQENTLEKIGYTADVLYGTISNFQFDYLRDTFEGFTLRRNRPFGQVILDEVDSMLIDNGGHIAKLASPFPGMECLRYVYIKIWQELHKVEADFSEEMKSEMEMFLKNCDKPEALTEKMENFEKEIKNRLKGIKLTDITVIPPHLKKYIEIKTDIWIKNAIYAKYNCHENQQYRIVEAANGEKSIVPVDYMNTGVTLKNTIWSNGLHQFVQLKHNLYLTFESLTCSFISNIGYIKNYKDRNIFGLTGTLGSSAEQALLSKIYNVTYAKLPTFKIKKLEEVPGLVFDDWTTNLILEILKRIDEERRAVLVICETIQDVITIEEKLKKLENGTFRIRKYANEGDSNETASKVKIGDIILATNIAGRGTNFKTTKELEKNGGLHVCVGFLPCNLRVEEQAFGRTSRQGNDGTAQLIIRRSEVEELEIGNVEVSFLEIKAKRDELERKRLDDINKNLLKELDFKDGIFKKFSEIYRTFKKEKNSKEKYAYVLNDLKGLWAFWLETKDFKAANIKKPVEEEFQDFLNQAEPILKKNQIVHNPFNEISLGNFYLDKADYTKAQTHLDNAIAMTGGDQERIMTGAYMKLFELSMARGEQTKKKIGQAIGQIFFIHINVDAGYKQKARKYLDLAAKAVQTEITYISKELKIESEDLSPIINENEKNNLLMKHLCSRYCALNMFDNNISSLVKNLESSMILDIGGQVETTVDNLKEGYPEFEKMVFPSELTELQTLGLSTLYSIKEVPEIPKEITATAQCEIAVGIALLASGIAFPPIFPLVGGLGADLISGGIIDLVVAVLVPQDDFNKKEFFTEKFISYGINVVTAAFSAIIQSVKILKKAIQFCKKLSTFLKESKHFQKLCQKLAKVVDKLQTVLEKMLLTAELKKLDKVDQLKKLEDLKASDVQTFEKLGGAEKLKELENLKKAGKLKIMHKFELLSNIEKTIGKNVAKGLFEKVVLEQYLDQILNAIFERFISEISTKLTETIKGKSVVMEKLQTANKEEINTIIDDFLETEIVWNILQAICPNFFNLFENKLGYLPTQILKVASEIAFDVKEICRLCTELVKYLEIKLPSTGKNDNNVDGVLKDISDKVSSALGQLMKNIVKKGTAEPRSNIVSKYCNSIHECLNLQPDAPPEEVQRKFRKFVLQNEDDENYKITKNLYDEHIKTVDK